MPEQPEAYARVVQRFASIPGDPEIGQVWRARWDRAADIVLLMDVADNAVQAVPLSIETEFGDDSAALLTADETPLGDDVLAWVGLARELPVRALDVLIGSVERDVLRDLRTHQPAGPPIAVSYDERSQIRDAVADRMDALARASWLPDDEQGADVAGLIRQKGLVPSVVAKELGESPGFVTAVMRGDRTLSETQAERMARLLEVDPRSLLRVSVTADLVWALDRPRLRRRLDAVGRSKGVMDEGAWRRRVATGELPTAARTTGGKNARQRWLGLIEEYLHANQA